MSVTTISAPDCQVTVVTLIGWGLLGLLAGVWRIARSRTVSVKSLALAAA